MLLLPPAVAEQRLVTALAATQQVTLTGFTRARTVLALSSETSGKVEQVFAEIGEPIPDNNRFACLDKTFVELDIENNRAEQARLRVEIAYFRKQAARHRKLVQQDSAAQSQLDDFERSLGSTSQQLKAVKVRERILVERRRRYCITAPSGWLVIDRLIEPGQWVNVGEPVGRVGDYSRLLIPLALSVPEYQALQHAAERLQVRLPDLNTSVPARIERISPAFDEQSRKIMLDLQITSGFDERRGGLRAELTLTLPLPSGTVLVPAAALRRRYEEYWLQRPDGEEIRVIYLGRAKARQADGGPLVRVVSPEVRPGDQFRLRTQ